MGFWDRGGRDSTCVGGFGEVRCQVPGSLLILDPRGTRSPKCLP